MKNNITKSQFNALIFCMSQRAIQEGKVEECIKLLKELEEKKSEDICKTKE